MSLRLMCLTAHPDDECGAFGGLLLRAADAGALTAVVCLTEGAAGSYRAEGQTDAELAAVRRGEFADACQALGVEDARLLRYPDGELWREPFEGLVRGLVEAIRRFRPHVVATFGGEGGVNQHRDHTIVSLAGTAAFHWAGREDVFSEQLPERRPWAAQKLYYAGTPFLATQDEEHLRTGTRTPASLQFELGKLKAQKWAAFEKHVSQLGLLERVRERFGEVLGREDFLLVAARKFVEDERDIWDGVVEEEYGTQPA